MTARRIACLTALTFLACIIFDLALSGPRRPFGYMASDVYYYFNIARHVVHEGRFAFDGLHATNGFHPLWQVVLVPIAAVFDGLRLLTVVACVGAGFIAIAIYLFGLALSRHGRLTPLFGLLPFGAYAALAWPAWHQAFGAVATGPDAAVPPLYGTLFQYVNGMESPLVLLCFALVVYFYARYDVLEQRASALVFGALLGQLVFARLDLVLVVGPVLAWLALGALWRRERLGNASVVVAAFVVPLAWYMIGNRVAFGAWMPVSGGIKSSFPHITQPNLVKSWACISDFRAQSYWRLFRVEQMLLPMFVAAFYFMGALICRPVSRVARLLRPISVGVLLLGTYDLLYVDIQGQGPWYLPVSTVYVSLVLLVLVERVRLPAAMVAVSCALSIVGFSKLHRFVNTGHEYASFYFDVAPKVRAHYGLDKPQLLENDDGIVAFSTGFRSMAGMGLALDPEAAQAWTHGNIVPLAVSRGFGRVSSAMYWLDAGKRLKLDLPSYDACRYVQFMLSIPDPGIFQCRVEYLDGNFAIIEIVKKE